jgi:hypothetical protein
MLHLLKFLMFMIFYNNFKWVLASIIMQNVILQLPFQSEVAKPDDFRPHNGIFS